MENSQTKVFSFEALFDPMVARAAAARAAQWNLPRHECHPLDRYPGRRKAADLAKFDEEIELAAVPEEEEAEELQFNDAGDKSGKDLDFDDDADFDDDEDDF